MKPLTRDHQLRLASPLNYAAIQSAKARILSNKTGLDASHHTGFHGEERGSVSSLTSSFIGIGFCNSYGVEFRADRGPTGTHGREESRKIKRKETLHLRYMLLAPILLLPYVAFGGDKPALCELANQSIVSRSSSGVAQVSNLGDIQITCSVPARTFPTKPGEGLNGLIATTTVYELSPNGSKKVVPSEVHLSSGGFRTDHEYVEFYLHIPVDPATQDAEARRYFTKVEQHEISEEARQQAIKRLQPLVYQHRVGVFLVGCRVADGKRTLGTGTVQLEILFKGRFSDVGLPAAPPA
jgi:hypothetical protein